MIVLGGERLSDASVVFVQKEHFGELENKKNAKSILRFFSGKYEETFFSVDAESRAIIYMGLGEDIPDGKRRKEIAAAAAKTMKKSGINNYSMDISVFVKAAGLSALRDVAEGIYLGSYEICHPGTKRREDFCVQLTGYPRELQKEAEKQLKKGLCLGKARVWAMDMVNAPGNRFHPMDFAREIMSRMENSLIQCELLVYGKLNAMGMQALTSVGKSSENPPCMLVMRYRGAGLDCPVTGLLGGGVTCDTGGYCLKPADSMLGVKGDMAGGAAVAAAMLALAKNKVPVNVTGVIPMCENRISPSSLVPGDVIGSYSGKTIEICNTDAEGRLIMADAMAYIAEEERVDRVLDIATLTGASVDVLGFSTAPVLSNDETFFSEFMTGAEIARERYWRLPIFEEQKDMLKSEIADVKNMGKYYCKTIVAGLFIQAFSMDKPWIHVDIAGTAQVDTPLYEGQPKGATGFGVSSLYYLLDQS